MSASEEIEAIATRIREAVSQGNTDALMAATERLGELALSNPDLGPQIAKVMNMPVSVTPALEIALKPPPAPPAPEPPAPVLPTDPRELTEQEKRYIFVPTKADIARMKVLKGTGPDVHPRIHMEWRDKNGNIQNWTPSKPWTCEMPFPIGILKDFFSDKPFFTDFKHIGTFRIIGVRYEAKSSLLEAIATRYLQNGSSIFDLYASNDNESCSWLESPYADRVILVHGDECQLDCNFATMPISQLDPVTAPSGRIYIVGKHFFANSELYYQALDRLTERFLEKDDWEIPNVICIREAQEWISARMKSGKPRTAKDSAEEFVSFHNSLYHTGHAVIIDSQRDVGVSKDVRELTSYLCMKALGGMDIPKKYNWIMRYVTPEVLRYLPKNLFALVKEKGGFSIGWFMMPPWHLVRGKSILKRLNIHPIFDQDKVRAEMQKATNAARASIGRGPAIDEAMHAFYMAEHIGDGDKEKPHGKSYRIISVENGVSEDALKREFAKHKAGVCSC